MNPIIVWTIRVVVLLCVYTFIATLLFPLFVRLCKAVDDTSSGDGAIAMSIFWLPVIVLGGPILVAFVLPWHGAMTIITRKKRAEKRETKRMTLSLAHANAAKKHPTELQQELMSALKLEPSESVYDAEEVVENFLKGRISLEEFNRAIGR